MSKKKLNVVPKEDLEKLKEYLEVPTFQPSLEQIQFKSEVYNNIKENEKLTFSCRRLATLGNSSKSTVHRWLSAPGFKEWLADPRSSKEIGESLIPDVLRELYRTAIYGEGTAKVAAMRAILEFYESKPKTTQHVEFDDISNMTDEEIEAELAKHRG
jgi:hypothetical protein